MNYKFLMVPIVCLCIMLNYSCGDVSEPTMAKPEIVLDHENLEMNCGESIRLVASFIPEETENRAHTWTSSNPDVATVDETGLVEAIAPGKTKITAKALSGGKTASCKVTVNEVDNIINAPYSLTTGGGIEFLASPFGLGYLEVLSSSTGIWHTGKEYSRGGGRATYTYSRTSSTSATFSSRDIQSITGRVWTITATLNFTESDSGTATYKADAPTGATESATTEFKIYTYYPTPQ